MTAATGTIDAALSRPGAWSGDGLRERRIRPVVGWAVVGAGFVVFVVYLAIAWVASGDFHAVRTEVGKAGAVRAWALALTLVELGVLTTAAVYAIRQSLRQRSLSFDTLLFLACATLYWQDPLINFFRQAFFYSSTLLNRGSWVEHIPGWISPNGHLLPEPLLFVGTMYASAIPLEGILAAFIMRRAKQRWPGFGKVRLVLCALAGLALWDLLMETFFVRTGLYAYAGVIRGASVWGGRHYQFPLYECLLWGGFLTFLGALRYFRDDRGRSAVERGSEQVRTSARRRTGLRLLALIGVVNVGMLIYNAGMMSLTFYADRAPAGYPSHLKNHMCGTGTRYECIGPETPVVLPGGRGTYHAQLSGRN